VKIKIKELQHLEDLSTKQKKIELSNVQTFSPNYRKEKKMKEQENTV